jgi:hypothetical protein
MAWRGFRRLAGQLRQKVSPNRALAAVLSKVTREEEEELSLMKTELEKLPGILNDARVIHGELSIFVNGVEALSRYEQKRLQRSLLIQKMMLKAGGALAGVYEAGFQPTDTPRIARTMMDIRTQAQANARSAMLALGKHQKLIILSQRLNKSIRKLEDDLRVIYAVELKLIGLLKAEAADEQALISLTEAAPSAVQQGVPPLQ